MNLHPMSFLLNNTRIREWTKNSLNKKVYTINVTSTNIYGFLQTWGLRLVIFSPNFMKTITNHKTDIDLEAPLQTTADFYLCWICLHFLRLGEEEHSCSLVEGYPIIGLVQTGSDLISNGQQEDIYKEVIALRWNVALGKKYLRLTKTTLQILWSK